MNRAGASPHVAEKSRPERGAALLREWLAVVETTADRTDDTWILLSLLRSARRAHEHLEAASADDTGCAAWACLNLLQIRILASYAAKSSENRRRLVDDMFVGLQFAFSARARLTDTLSREDLEGCEALAARVQARRAGSQGRDVRPLLFGQMAAGAGLRDEYRALLRIVSPLGQASPLSVLTVEAEPEAAELRSCLVTLGRKYVSDMLQDVAALANTLLPMSGRIPTA